jgi:hypothetical protein
MDEIINKNINQKGRGKNLQSKKGISKNLNNRKKKNHNTIIKN